MLKLAVFLAVVACAFAAPKPGFLAHEPVAYAAPAFAVAHSVPVATSYQNTYKVSVKSPVVASYAAAAPVAYAAPVAHYAAAPVAYAAPVAHYAAAPVW